MSRYHLSLVSLLLLVLGAGTVLADEPADPDNAAPVYREALQKMPSLNVGEAAWRIIGNPGASLLGEDAQDILFIIKSSDAALAGLHAGAKLPKCDWQLDYDKGPFLLLDHAQKSRTMSILACLRARLQFEQHKTDPALDDLFAALVLARRVGSDGTLIGMVVQSAMEGQVLDTLAAHLPSVPKETVQGLPERFDQLPRAATMIDALRADRRLWQNYLRKNIKKPTPELIDYFNSLVLYDFFDQRCGNRPGSGVEQFGRRFIEKAGLRPVVGVAHAVPLLADYVEAVRDPKRMDEFLQEADAHWEEAIALLELPLERVEAAANRLATKVQMSRPLVRITGPDCSPRWRYFKARMETRQALFQAAITAVAQGREHLKDIKDPYGSGPFKQKPFPGGFELVSELKMPQFPPIAMKVGRKPNPE